jgi:LysM repeat protein
LFLTKADFNISQTHKAYLANGVNGTGSSAGTASNQIGGGSATTTGAYGATYHIVKKGDTLSAIAKRYGTTVDKLCAKNGISKTSILRLGQKIRIK